MPQAYLRCGGAAGGGVGDVKVAQGQFEGGLNPWGQEPEARRSGVAEVLLHSCHVPEDLESPCQLAEVGPGLPGLLRRAPPLRLHNENVAAVRYVSTLPQAPCTRMK